MHNRRLNAEEISIYLTMSYQRVCQLIRSRRFPPADGMQPIVKQPWRTQKFWYETTIRQWWENRTGMPFRMSEELTSEVPQTAVRLGDALRRAMDRADDPTDAAPGNE